MYYLHFSKVKLAVYLINMTDAEERLQSMLAKLSNIGLPVQRVEGVNGGALNYPIPEFCELSHKLTHGRRTSPPEVGCYLSHVQSAREFLASDAELALILEDDVSFEDDFLTSIDAAAYHAESWDILRLSTVSNGRKFKFRSLGQNRALAIAITREKGAGAYIINRRAATWITTKLVPMKLAYDIAFDLEYLSGLKSAFIYPLCATQNVGFKSQIQCGLRAFRLPRWRYFTVLPYRTYLEVTRFICRGSLLAWYKTKGLFSKELSYPSEQTVTLKLTDIAS